MATVNGGWFGWALTSFTIIFFWIFRRIAWSCYPVPPAVKDHDDEFRVVRWQNLVVSYLHAIMTGSWATINVILYGKHMREDMVAFVNWPTYALCCFATGYFLYDGIDIIINKRALDKWESLLHHLAILISAAYVVTYVECVAYQAFGMVVEINTIFLHRRQLYLLSGTSRDDPSFRWDAYINIITFVIFRSIPLAYLTFGIFYDGHRVPLWYLIFYGICMVLLNVINIILFYRLVRADCTRQGRGGNGNGWWAKYLRRIVMM